MTEQIWLPIQGYEGLYEVSNFGEVRRLSGIRTLKNGVVRKEEGRLLKINKRGRYMCKTLSKDNIEKACYIHRLVAQSFIPNPENKPYINHKDNDRCNNHVNNLEWVTQKENLDHAAQQGRMVKPPIHYISFERLKQAKELLDQGVSRTEISKRLGMSRHTMYHYFGSDKDFKSRKTTGYYFKSESNERQHIGT